MPFQVAATAGVGCLTTFVLEGLGQHIYCLPPEQVPEAIKWSIIAQKLNIIGIGLAKISVCLCVLRILDRTRTGFRIFLWVVIAFVSASHLCRWQLNGIREFQENASHHTSPIWLAISASAWTLSQTSSALAYRSSYCIAFR